MFTFMTDRVSTNTYCLVRTWRLSRRSESSVGRVTHEREAPTDTVQPVTFLLYEACRRGSSIQFRLVPKLILIRYLNLPNLILMRNLNLILLLILNLKKNNTTS